MILYTSGTTGFPKGATLSHQNIRATVHAFNHLCQMQQDDRILLAVPLFHCYGQNALLNAGLNAGATLILQRRADLQPNQTADPSASGDQAVRRPDDVSVDAAELHSRRTQFGRLLLFSCCNLAAASRHELAGAIRHAHLRRLWADRNGTLCQLQPPRAHYVPGSIGTPVDLVEMKIVDPESGETCPPGERGEIVIRGPNVMLGYWNRPEETAAAIRNGWFRSGDIGYVDREWLLLHRGSLEGHDFDWWDESVSRPKWNACCWIIRACLEVAVVGLPDDVMGEKVAAFIVGGDETAFSLRESEGTLPRADWERSRPPRHFEFVQELPRNPAGKVLKTQLREQWAAS